MSTTENPLFEGFKPPATPQPEPGLGAAIAGGMEQAQAPANGRKKKKGAAKKAAVAKEPAAPKPPRKKAASRPAKAAPAPKMDMLLILRATAGLKEADLPVFESLAAAFAAMSKSERSRILPAIQKLFA